MLLSYLIQVLFAVRLLLSFKWVSHTHKEEDIPQNFQDLIWPIKREKQSSKIASLLLSVVPPCQRITLMQTRQEDKTLS